FDFSRYTTLDPYLTTSSTSSTPTVFPVAPRSATQSVSVMIIILASISRSEFFSKLILIGASPRSASRF
ncbi:hypothetical protein LINGRAHAP2_LOCUS5003, partial [Linum grandiflorum]